MKSHTLIAFSAFLVLAASFAGGAEEIRNWTRASDGRVISAALVDHDEAAGKVTLRLENGTTATLDAAILSEADQAHLKQRAERRAERIEASKSGRLETFEPENGGGHKVHIYKPPGYIDGDASNATRPAAFLYDAKGNSKKILNVLKPAADELGWVLVGIDAYRNTSSVHDRYDERMELTKIAFAAATERVDYDPAKIVFSGMSGGGWWSYQSAAEVTDKAAAVLAFGGWMGDMYDKRYSKKMAVAMVNGDADKNANSREEPDGDFLRKRAGAEVKIFHFPGGHVLASPEKATEAARWIHETKDF